MRDTRPIQHPMKQLTAEEWKTLIETHGGIAPLARAHDLNRKTITRWITNAKGRSKDALDIPAMEASENNRTVSEILQSKRKIYERKSARSKEKRLVEIKVKDSLPMGIIHFGDPHLDDDGCDIEALECDMRLVKRTDGLFAGNLGDTTNNWIGRLARLYSDQTTTAKEAWQLAEWFIRSLGDDLLYMIAGNHDLWSGASDPLDWMTRQHRGLKGDNKVRFSLNFPNKKVVRVAAQHIQQGHSMWNPSHGSMRAAQMGLRDHLILAGHKHSSGYGIVKDPFNNTLSHCVQVGSYKVIDRYGVEKGMLPLQFSPSVLTIINPQATTEAGLVTVFHDTTVGAACLRAMRETALTAGA